MRTRNIYSSHESISKHTKTKSNSCNPPSVFRKITSDETISFTLVQRHVSYRCIARLLQPGVKTVFKKFDHKPDEGQMVKTLKICVFIMFSRLMIDAIWNCRCRPKGIQTVILCTFQPLSFDYPLINNCILEINLTKSLV